MTGEPNTLNEGESRRTFEVSVQKRVEVDFSDEQIQGAMSEQQLTPEDIVKESFHGNEVEQIDATEKLLAIEVDATEVDR